MTLMDKVLQLRRHVIQRAAAGIPVTRVCREVGISRALFYRCLLYISPSPRDLSTSRMPSSA